MDGKPCEPITTSYWGLFALNVLFWVLLNSIFHMIYYQEVTTPINYVIVISSAVPALFSFVYFASMERAERIEVFSEYRNELKAYNDKVRENDKKGIKRKTDIELYNEAFGISNG